jgi:hypothetical protein
MNCPCDELIFPPDLDIPAGLTALRRQIATFPEFRAAMLAAIPTKGALVMWRARSNYDFGVMLLEMWAYVCDSISFYDQVRADEFYDRTAQLRSSVRMLTNLLGYTPRPAVAAMADLAVLVEGRQPVLLPAGTAFRSGAFPGSAPQVFELGEPTKAHPFDNQWTIAQNRPVSIGGGSLTYLLVEAKTSKLKKGSYFVFEVVGTSAYTTARTVTAVSDFKAPDGITYKKIEWSGAAIAAPANTRPRPDHRVSGFHADCLQYDLQRARNRFADGARKERRSSLLYDRADGDPQASAHSRYEHQGDGRRRDCHIGGE